MIVANDCLILRIFQMGDGERREPLSRLMRDGYMNPDSVGEIINELAMKNKVFLI